MFLTTIIQIEARVTVVIIITPLTLSHDISKSSGVKEMPRNYCEAPAAGVR